MTKNAAEVHDLNVSVEIDYARVTCRKDTDLVGVETSLLLLRSADATLTTLDRLFRQHGISSGKFNMLLTIAAHTAHDKDDVPKPAQIAKRLGVRRPTITGLLDNLEKDGLVERKPHATDGRALRLELTKKGKKMLEKLLPDYWGILAKLSAPLNGVERKGMLRGVEKVYSVLPSLGAGDD
jgi:MarR family transcriptional regulator, negative regulator of the multidrug operon emrRAB